MGEAPSRFPVSPLSCPVCELPLERLATAFVCGNGHSFDVAHEGYVNLLPSQHKSRGIEGDVRDMLEARRRFLDAGHFAPLDDALDAVLGCILAARAPGTPAAVVETGCGEGHYIGGLSARLGDVAAWLGADLSKVAVKMAARRHPGVLFFVCDVHKRLYLRDSCASVLLDVFAPRNAGEFARVLEPDGVALIAIPAQSHLASARQALGLLGVEPEKEGNTLARFEGDFRLAARHELRFPLELEPAALADLVEMGPNHWHGAHGEANSPISTEASIVLLQLQRT